MTDNSYQGKVYKAQGGTELVLPDGTSLRIEDGAKVYKDGVDITSSLGGSSGGDFVKISSGSISSPVPYFSVALPGAYSGYELVLSGLLNDSSVSDIMYGVLSFDGGSTYLSDGVNLDSYNSTTTLFNPGVTSADKYMYLGASAILRDSVPSGIIFNILPGDASNVAQVSTDQLTLAGQNLAATVPPTLARATNIRIFADFLGANFTAGNWTLYGVN